MARIVLALAAGAAALAPGSKPAAQTRRELGQGLVAAVGALGAQAAVASAGDSPKFSFFGFFGNGGTMSEGAMYGTDQTTPTYSPYSVYGKLGDEKAVYKKYNAKEIDFKKKMLAESERRVKGVDAAIGKKNWESVRRDLDGQVYNMRNTMNYLAAGPSAQPGAKAAAKRSTRTWRPSTSSASASSPPRGIAGAMSSRHAHRRWAASDAASKKWVGIG